MVDVNAGVDGHEVCEELEEDDFREGEKAFAEGWDEEDEVGEGLGAGVSVVGEAEDGGALGAHVLHEGDGFFVAQDGFGVSGIEGGDHDERGGGVDDGVGAVFELAAGVAFGVEVGGLFELEGAFTGDGVVEASAEEEKVFVSAELGGDGAGLRLPVGQPGGEDCGEGLEFAEGLFDVRRRHFVAGLSGEKSEEVEDKELRGEALGGRDGALEPGEGGEGDAGFAVHGGAGDVGDGEGLVAGGSGFA